jgi:hypothetical protein
MFDDKDLKRAKIDIKAELNRLEAQQTAKESCWQINRAIRPFLHHAHCGDWGGGKP